MYAAASLSGYADTLYPIVQELLKAGANPNIATQDGETALTLAAAFAQHIAIADALIAAGADINATEKNTGMSVLMTAANNNNTPLVEKLAPRAHVNQQTPHGITALMFAANNGQPHMVSALMRANADVNAVDKDGNNALIGAVRTFKNIRKKLSKRERQDYLNVIQTLIAAGANKKQKNNEGKSFTDYAQGVELK
jgi:ankyrin repeat protein